MALKLPKCVSLHNKNNQKNDIKFTILSYMHFDDMSSLYFPNYYRFIYFVFFLKWEEQRRAITVNIEKSLSSTTTLSDSEDDNSEEAKHYPIQIKTNKLNPSKLQIVQKRTVENTRKIKKATNSQGLFSS